MSHSPLSSRLRFRQLHLLCGVAQGKSFRALAQEMSLSQPAISKMARELEAAVGAQIFVRGPEGMLLTPIGQSLTQSAHLILGQVDRIAAVARLREGRRRQLLRIGAPLYTGVSLLAEPVARLSHHCKDVQVQVIDGTAAVLFQRLLDGRLDYIVGSLPVDLRDAHSGQIQVEGLYPDEVRFFTHPQTMAGERTVELDELVDYEWVLPTPDSLIRGGLRQALIERRLTVPEPFLETAIVPMIGSVVAEQPGLVGALRADAAHHLSRSLGLKLLKVRPVIPLPPVAIIALRGILPSPAAETFFGFIRDRVSALMM